MIIKIALIASVILQFGAFIITISLIKKTKFSVSWIFISLSFLLMAFRRLTELIEINTQSFHSTQTFVNSWIAVLISILMFGASIYIRRIFQLQDKLNRMQKENEAKVLSAIIKTEEKERKHFSKELHDGLGPILSSIKMILSAVNKTTIGKKNEQIINKAEMAVDNAITSVKEISNNLSPHLLERYGLEKAVKIFIDNIKGLSNTEILLKWELEDEQLNYNKKVILYRIISELLNNSFKYAKATKIELNLCNFDNKLQFHYFDNGVGFDSSKTIQTGLGIENIKSRVKSLNGNIELFSKPNSGFFVNIILP